MPRQYFEADDSGVLRILSESEWRGMGITQSLGWEMYATHGELETVTVAAKAVNRDAAPEPHILLFRREKDYQEKVGAFPSSPLAPPHAAPTVRNTRQAARHVQSKDQKVKQFCKYRKQLALI